MTKISIEESYSEDGNYYQKGDLLCVSGQWYMLYEMQSGNYSLLNIAKGYSVIGSEDSAPGCVVNFVKPPKGFIQGLNYFSRDTLEITLKEVGGNV